VDFVADLWFNVLMVISIVSINVYNYYCAYYKINAPAFVLEASVVYNKNMWRLSHDDDDDDDHHHHLYFDKIQYSTGCGIVNTK
jgi:hypothetical protein